MPESDLVKAASDFLDAMANECFQPGEAKDQSRDELLKQLKLEKTRIEHLNAHTYPQYECEKCSNLLSRLEVMFNNTPDIKGIHTEIGHIGNKYVDYGYQEAINRVVSIIKNPNFNENEFHVSLQSPHSETIL